VSAESDAAWRLSREARDSYDHIAAAEALLRLVRPGAAYRGTPLCVSAAQVHATLAIAERMPREPVS
jgi:hypothetical protein